MLVFVVSFPQNMNLGGNFLCYQVSFISPCENHARSDRCDKSRSEQWGGGGVGAGCSCLVKFRVRGGIPVQRGLMSSGGGHNYEEFHGYCCEQSQVGSVNSIVFRMSIQ